MKLALTPDTRWNVDFADLIPVVGASGFSYEDAANICGVPIGTMKSRVARGRLRRPVGVSRIHRQACRHSFTFEDSFFSPRRRAVGGGSPLR